MLDLTVSGAIARIRLARPPVNAFDDRLVGDLAAAVRRCEDDPDVGVVVIDSADPRILSAGADIKMLHAAAGSGAGVDRLLSFVESFQAALSQIESSRLVSAAVITGAAFGGGLELALACDFRIVQPDSRLGLTETNLGLIPGAGGTQRLTRVVGRQQAKRLIYTGQVIDGRQAHRLGLADFIHDDAAQGADELAGTLAGRPRRALEISKECIDLATSDDGYALERSGSRELYTNDETRRLLADFLHRR